MIEDTLEEDLLEEFKGGVLSIEPSTKPSTDKADNSDNETNQKTNKWSAGFISPLTNKLSATLWSRKDEVAQPSKSNTLQPTFCITENPNNFFTFRDSVLAKALTESQEQFLDEEADGPLLEAYLLTQISHWNSDKERLLLLTARTLVIVKYDFIALKRLGYRKLPLDAIDEVVVGDLVYPAGSLIPNRNMKGVRLVWNKNKPLNYASQWNPFTEEIPFCTFTYHPLFFNKDCGDEDVKSLYNLDNFIEKLCQTIAGIPRPEACTIQEHDIILQSYVGLGSLIHNRNALGFFKVRGKFSF